MAPSYYRGLIVALMVVFSVKLAQSDSFSNQVQGHRDLDREIGGYNYASGKGLESMYMSPSNAVDPEGPTSSSTVTFWSGALPSSGVAGAKPSRASGTFAHSRQ